MTLSTLLGSMLVMAGVTYLIRMLPLALFRLRIRSRFLLSLLHYLPYAVLGAMTFPAIFSATGSLASAVVGCAAALVLSYHRYSLLLVAIVAAASAYVTTLVLSLL